MSTKRLIIGVTGGVACGKSLVVNELKRRGARIIDADRIARQIVKKKGQCYAQLIKQFGKTIRTKAGNISRTKLRRIVFGDSLKRKKLEKITHPVIIRNIKSQLARLRDGVIVLDAPLLFEAGIEDLVDRIIVVWSNQHLQIKRLAKRRKLTFDEARAIMRAQMPISKKIIKADYVIRNTGTIRDLRRSVRAICEKLPAIVK